MRKQILIIGILLTAFCGTSAEVTRPETYNYKRGLEMISDGETEKAMDYFQKDIKENPKSGYPYLMIALLQMYSNRYGDALSAVNNAIKLLPKNDKEYLASAYGERGDIYIALEDTTEALNNYSTAIKLNLNDDTYFMRRIAIYYYQGKYDQAKSDINKAVEINPGNTTAYLWHGCVLLNEDEVKQALEKFNYAIKLDSSKSLSYAWRAAAYEMLEMWDEMTDDLKMSMSLEWNKMAINMLQALEEPAFSMMVSKFKIASAKEPDNIMWPYLTAHMYYYKKQYKTALKYYKEANKRDADDVTYSKISSCYEMMGDYESALININAAINMDTTEISYQSEKANLLFGAGRTKEAIAEWDKVLAKEPEFAWGYHRRGWFKETIGDIDGAIEDLTMAIVLAPYYSYSFVTRGNLYTLKGEKALAKADYEKVLELEQDTADYECKQYAYLALGDTFNAKRIMDIIIERDKDSGAYYEATCLYSKMRDRFKALEYLEKSLELGFRRFHHISVDHDLDFIRDTREFPELIERYKAKMREEISGISEDEIKSKDELIGTATGYSRRENESSRSDGTKANDKAFGVRDNDIRPVTVTAVPFVKEGGVCKVKCAINGLPLHFVFDTGASDVTLSMVEASFMLKNGYLSEKDIVGKTQYYVDANGDVSTGTVIILRDVEFAGQHLSNVRASVVRNQRAPLLLGQSVLGRLGKIEIDNTAKTLKIIHEKNVTESNTPVKSAMREAPVLKSADQMPAFPGGDAALKNFLAKNIRYPMQAAEKGIEGKVVVQFIVNEIGKVGDIKVVRSKGAELDAEAVRVCKLLPDFEPARDKGEKVSVWYTLPIIFSLKDDE